MAEHNTCDDPDAPLVKPLNDAAVVRRPVEPLSQ
jgi:hypothetical protein